MDEGFRLMARSDPELVEGSLAWGWLEQGWEQGRIEARAEASRRLLSRVLQARFGELPSWAKQLIAVLPGDKADQALDQVFDAETLESVLPDSLGWKWLLRGRDEGARRVFLRMVVEKFGPPPEFDMFEYHVHTMGAEELEGLCEHLVKAQSFEELSRVLLNAHASHQDATSCIEEEPSNAKRVVMAAAKLGGMDPAWVVESMAWTWRRTGREYGREHFRARGAEEARRLVMRMLVKRFATVPSWVEERLTTASEEQLEALSERMLGASAVNELFETLRVDATG